MKHIKARIFAVALLSLAGCVTPTAQLRRDAATATGCRDVRVLEYTSDVSRVDACGRVMTCYWRQKPGRDTVDRLAGIGGHWECSRTGD